MILGRIIILIAATLSMSDTNMLDQPLPFLVKGMWFNYTESLVEKFMPKYLMLSGCSGCI